VDDASLFTFSLLYYIYHSQSADHVGEGNLFVTVVITSRLDSEFKGTGHNKNITRRIKEQTKDKTKRERERSNTGRKSNGINVRSRECKRQG